MGKTEVASRRGPIYSKSSTALLTVEISKQPAHINGYNDNTESNHIVIIVKIPVQIEQTHMSGLGFS